MVMIDVKKMNKKDRLQTMEAIWESFLAEEKEIEAPQWHGKILEERKQKIREGKAEFVSLKDLKSNRN